MRANLITDRRQATRADAEDAQGLGNPRSRRIIGLGAGEPTALRLNDEEAGSMSSQVEGFIERAGTRLQDARNDLERFRLDVCISNSLESIELSAKATFLLLGESYPIRHDFKDEEVAVLFERVPPHAQHLNLPRLFVLHELWRTFYTLSKYGKDRWDVPAKDLFKRTEAELAVAHATEWSIAANVLQSLSRGG